jgi:serine/threonine protein phosphatase PrpC
VNSQVPTSSLAESRRKGAGSGRLVTRAVGRTDPGLQRTTNEDAMLIEDQLRLYLVCDGMGGHASGQVASELAVFTVAQALKSAAQPAAGEAHPLIAALKAANRAVFERSQADPACHNMGTTAVAVQIDQDAMHVCHCGDSRLYLLRRGVLTQLTRDHSLLNLYKDKPELEGQMGPAASNVIVRAIGLDDTVEIDHQVVTMEDGDLYLLCCDGLTDLVEDWMIREIMTSGEPLEVMSENLVRAANMNGGSDNITVLLIAVRADQDAIERDMEAKEYSDTRPGF